jgi:hypothetical protein
MVCQVYFLVFHKFFMVRQVNTSEGNCLRAYISFFPEPWTQNVAAIEECAGALGLEVGRIKQTRDVYLTPADENIFRGCEWFVERVRRFLGLESREGAA